MRGRGEGKEREREGGIEGEEEGEGETGVSTEKSLLCSFQLTANKKC